MISGNQLTRPPEHLPPTEGPQSHKMVSVYLRLTSKFGKKISIPRLMTVEDLMKIVAVEFSIPQQQQIIYLASEKLNSRKQRQVELHEGSILHIHFIEELKHESLTLCFQQVTAQGLVSKSNQYVVDPNQVISRFVADKMDSDVLLVESGRKLDNSRTFKQEEVAYRATIYYYVKQKQLNHDQFEKDFNKLFDQDEETSQQDQNQALNRIKEERQKRIDSRKAKRQEASSGQEMERTQPRPNFKKKKSICLKAVKKNPEDSNYTWKRDCSFSQGKNSKKLAKVLRGRKNGHSPEVHDKNSQNQHMTISDKLKLRQEFKKLFLSETLGLLGAQKNKPSCSLESQNTYMSESEGNKRQPLQKCQSQTVF